jgi:hypothetical protein
MDKAQGRARLGHQRVAVAVRENQDQLAPCPLHVHFGARGREWVAADQAGQLSRINLQTAVHPPRVPRTPTLTRACADLADSPHG